MNPSIRSLIAGMAHNAVNPSSTTPYAVMSTDVPSDEGDSICLLLPDHCQPNSDSGTPADIVSVHLENGIMSWAGPQGQPIQVGSPLEPIQAQIAQALASQNGLLALFVNESTAEPQAWAVMHLATKH